MIRRSSLIALEVLLALVAALLIGLSIAWWRLSQGPIELSYLTPQIQHELSTARGGRPVLIDGVELAWSEGGSLELRALGVKAEDGHGGVLSQAREARIEIAVLPLLIGRVSLVRADFLGGELTATRKPDGALWIAFGPATAPPDIIVPPARDNETLEQSVNRTLDGLRDAFRSVGRAGGLREVAIRDAQLNIIDEKSGARWNADAASFELARSGNRLTLAAGARLEGMQGLAPATLHITTDAQFQSAVVEFGARDVRPRALFSPAALGAFAGLDAPMSARISIGLDRRIGINRFDGDVTIGRGNADMAGGRFNLDGGRVHGRYDIHSDVLLIDQLVLAGQRTRIRGEAQVRNVSRIFRAAPDQPAAFDVTLPSMTLDVPGTFSAPLDLADVQVTGAIVSADRTINFTGVHARAGNAIVDGAGRYYFAPAGPDHALHPGLFFDASISGALSVRQVIQGWPMTLASATHSYLDRTLKAGTVTNARAHIDVRPSDSVSGPLRNEAVNVSFDVTGGEMQFLDTMSPVVGVRATGLLQGNSFHLTATDGRLNNVTLSDGHVDVARFNPHEGGFVSISAHGDGDARNLVEVLMQRPLDLRQRLPVDAASVTGHGAVNITLQRPMLAEAPFEQWRFSVDGRLQNFAGNMTTRRLAISNGQLQVRGDQRAIVVTGPVRAGTSNVQIAWTENLNRRDRSSSEYQISGDFDAGDLVRLGYPIASYAMGRVGVTVTGQGRGFDVDQAQIGLDLTNAAVETPWMFWTKRAGQPASARFVVARQRDGGLAFNGIDARGAGLVTQGNVVVSQDARIMAINLTRLLIDGRSNARITATRGADNALDVAVRGSLFDAAPFMSADNDAGGQNAGQAGPPDAVRANVQVDSLKMRGGVTLSNARVALSVARGALTTLTATGASPRGGTFNLALGPRPEDPQGHIVFESSDAGFAVAALTGTPNIVGGRASAAGDWRPGPPNQAHFDVHLHDFQVVRLPALARLISSAGSLTGLAEMLNGDGIGFSSLEAHMTYVGNRVSFTEGRMTGPSLGLTGNGAYDVHADNLDVNGVVAPSPVLNLSMLGNVPVIGNLLVSRRGEGVFGMTYSISGRAAAPHVFVNPVSALTPGILRRIFEPVTPRGGAHALDPRDTDAATAPSAPAPPSADGAAPAAAVSGAQEN